MPNEEGNDTPNGADAKEALAELAKEGETVETPKEEETKTPEEPKKESAKEDPKEDTPPARKPTMVEAYKLHIAEDQKEAALQKVAELEDQLQKLSEQKGPITKAQKEDIADDIKALAEENGLDPEFLTKFANSILSKAKPSEALFKLQEQQEALQQELLYNQEFERDVLPLVKEAGLSDQALSQLKTQLKDYAFSEVYAKVPLKEIFRIKEEELDIKTSRRSAEGKGIKVRTEVVDLDNISEEDLDKLTPEQLEAFTAKKTSGGWKGPRQVI